jgi:hypothetical protein
MSPRGYPFSAHMTIAEFVTVERTNALVIELKDAIEDGAFECRRVSHAVPDFNFHFLERRQLNFGAPRNSPTRMGCRDA